MGDATSGLSQRKPAAWRLGLLSFLFYAMALVLVALGPVLVPAMLSGGDEGIGGAVLSRAAEIRAWLLSDRATAQHPHIAVVTVGDELAESSAYTIPTDRGMLAKLVAEADRLGARVIGIDFLFLKRTEPDKDRTFAEAVRTARAKVVLGALDKRGELRPGQRAFQDDYLGSLGRAVGFLNFRTEFDGVVRYIARPGDPGRPKSFSHLLAEAFGAESDGFPGRRLAWLRPPKGETAFLELPAEALLPGTRQRAEAEVKGQLARLEGRIVLLGAALEGRDRHKTPFSFFDGDMAGVLVHAHMLAAQIDKRSFSNLAPNLALPLLFTVGALGLWFGWAYHSRGRVSLALVLAALLVIFLVDAVAFARLRIIFPFVLTLLACYLGARAGLALGKLPWWKVR